MPVQVSFSKHDHVRSPYREQIEAGLREALASQQTSWTVLVGWRALEPDPKPGEATRFGYYFVVKCDGVRLEAIPVEDGEWDVIPAPEGSSSLQECVRERMQGIVDQPYQHEEKAMPTIDFEDHDHAIPGGYREDIEQGIRDALASRPSDERWRVRHTAHADHDMYDFLFWRNGEQLPEYGAEPTKIHLESGGLRIATRNRIRAYLTHNGMASGEIRDPE